MRKSGIESRGQPMESRGSMRLNKSASFAQSSISDDDRSSDDSDAESVMTEATGFTSKTSGSVKSRTKKEDKGDGQHDKRVSKIEDEINLSQLRELKEVFERADADGGGALEIDEFLREFESILDSNMSQDELVTLFMRIDANANGSIDWDEFSTFLLLGNEGMRKMKDDSSTKEFLPQSFVDKNPVTQLHRDLITRVVPHPKLDRYFTTSRDGTIKVWNSKTLVHEQTIPCTKKWVTDAVHMKYSDRLAVASLDRVISVYDCNRGELLRKFKGRKYVQSNGSSAPLPHGGPGSGAAAGGGPRGSSGASDGFSAGASSSSSASSASSMLGGSKVDTVTLEELMNVPMCMCYMPVEGPEEMEEHLLLGVEEGEILSYQIASGGVLTSKPSLSYTNRWKPHTDWVTKIKMAPELDAIISCSLDKSIRLLNMEKGKQLRVLQGHRKGIFSFDWSKSLKLIASCGLERDILVWNPFISNPLSTLTGHKAPLVDVVFNEQDYMLVSMSTDKVVKVWDVRTYKCMQTFSDKKRYTPEDKLSAISYDPKQNCVITASTMLSVWPMRRNFIQHGSDARGHQEPVLTAMFNTNFKQVVSADSTTICVWDLETGSLVFKFSMPGNDKITAICYDLSQRRVVTGLHDGAVKVWNFINGQCLKEVDSDLGKEITSVCYIERESQEMRYILASGWNRRVAVWKDTEDFEEPIDRVFEKQKSDFLCMAYCSAHNTVAAGTEAGTIVLYNVNSGDIRLTIHVHAEGGPIAKSNESLVAAAAAAQAAQAQASSPLPAHKGRPQVPAMSITSPIPHGRNSNSLLAQAVSGSANAAPSPAPQLASFSSFSSVASSPGFQSPQRAPVASSSNPALLSSSPSASSSLRQAAVSPSPSKRSASSLAHASPSTAGFGLAAAANSATISLESIQSASPGSSYKTLNIDFFNSASQPTKEEGRTFPLGYFYIEDMVFLEHKQHLLVSCGGDGLVRFWDVRDGSILHTTHGIVKDGESLTCICTDSPNQYIIAGDTQGYISIWDISAVRANDKHISEENVRQFKHFRAHQVPVSSVSYVEERNMLVTSSADGSVKLFTLQGVNVGTFGQQQPWVLSNPSTFQTIARRAARKTATIVEDPEVVAVRAVSPAKSERASSPLTRSSSVHSMLAAKKVGIPVVPKSEAKAEAISADDEAEMTKILGEAAHS